MQLAFELELEGGHATRARAIEQELGERHVTDGGTSRNADDANAAVSGDLSFDAETATLLFTISRAPDLVAHALEERRRHETIRYIDPTKHKHDGPAERHLVDSLI